MRPQSLVKPEGHYAAGKFDSVSQGDIATEDALYRELRNDLAAAGCFKFAPWATFGNMVLVFTVYCAGYFVLLSSPDWAIRLPILMLLACAQVHGGFIAHEALHGSLTRNRARAELFGQFFMTFLTGLSYSHFQDIHRRHHKHCNEEAFDPDMQSGVFSLYEKSALTKTGLGKIISRYQGYLIWILISLQGFSIKFDGIVFMARNWRSTFNARLAFCLHILGWSIVPIYVLGAADALTNFLLMNWFVGPYLGAIFLVNHIGRKIGRPDEVISTLRQRVESTRNLGRGPVSGFLFGGLNNHIEHHLFSTIPAHRLPKARAITSAFCRRHGLEYRETTWFVAAKEVVGHASAMSRFVPS